MKKFLVTGGSGFIGTNLVDALLKENVEVLNLDRFKPEQKHQVQYWKQVDILDQDRLESEIVSFNPEVIIHLAAVTDLNGTTLEYYDANMQGTKNIVDIAKKLPSLKKVLYTSSMYVCQPGYIPKDFDDYKPHTLYGESKVKGEQIVKSIESQGYEWIIIRPTSIWGPWFNIPYIDFFSIVHQGKYFDFGDTCTKTYGYIENTIHQILGLIEVGGLHGKTFYLGDEPAIQISEWANEISIEMGNGPIKSIPFFLIRLAAFGGDLLSILKIKFPMTSFRLRNMTTNNVLPLANLYEIVGPTPVARLEGVKRTIRWLSDVKGYRMKSQ
jgi:nucleoside-diphosphate-sugar epimerase